ncbi:MAG: interleukin-like EMT inducer domain-containing protein [Anaerolineae bacterium]
MKGYRVHLLVPGLYTLLAIALTWPLAAHLATHIPGSAVWAFDESTFVWNMWWFKFSLLDLGQSPLHTDYIFYPLGIDLVLYTYNFFNSLLGLPLQMVLPLPLASNLVILFAYVMSGYGAYLLVLYLLLHNRVPGRQPPTPLRYGLAAFVAGAAYAFAASRMVYAALGHYDMVTAQWFPFYTVFLLKTLRQPGYRNAVLAGLFATFALLAEMIYGVFLLFLSLILLVFHLRAGKAPQPASYVPSNLLHIVYRVSPSGYHLLRVVPRLVVLAFTVAILWSPVMVPVLRAFGQGDFALVGWGEGLKLSADLAGWFTPTALHPVFGASDWSAHLRSVVEGNAPFRDVNTVFLGYGVLALAILGAIGAGRQARAWVLAAVVFAIFTLGPLLQINGRFLFPLDNLLREQGLAQDVTFPMPFALLHYIPIIKANRVPNRFSVVLSLSLAVLVGYGVYWVLTRLAAGQVTNRGVARGWLPASLLLVLVLFDQVSVPLPLTDARVPRPYRAIAAEPGDFAVLQLPLGWRNSFRTWGAERTQLQYYQSSHHKRMLAGNISRAPDFKFDYFARIPLFHTLMETELYRQVDAETLDRARAQAGALMTLYDVRYLIVHDPIPLRYPYADTMPVTRDLAFSLLPLEPEPVASGDGAYVYRVIQSPLPNPLRVDFGDWTSAPYRGEGWADDEEVFAATANWVLGTEARVFFPVRGPGDRYLSLQVAPFTYARAAPQTLGLSVNGQALEVSWVLSPGWQVVEATLPGSVLRQGLNTLTLNFDHAIAPASVLPGSGDSRLLAGAVDWVEVREQ